MSYEFLTTIVVINAFVTVGLWLSLSKSRGSPDRPQLKKKAANALWRSKPIVPRHDPPKVAGGDYYGLANEEDQLLFFSDFKDFADVINADLAEEYRPSAFRLQDSPEGDRRLDVDFDHGPTLGRTFTIFYNQTEVGKLEISPGYKYGSDSQTVFTSLQIDWARFIGFDELTRFIGTISEHVASNDPKSQERADSWQRINYALMQTLWSNYRISKYGKPQSSTGVPCWQ
jgi:hypothetical protein